MVPQSFLDELLRREASGELTDRNITALGNARRNGLLGPEAPTAPVAPQPEGMLSLGGLPPTQSAPMAPMAPMAPTAPTAPVAPIQSMDDINALIGGIKPLETNPIVQQMIGDDIRATGTSANQKLYTSSTAAQPTYNYAEIKDVAQQISSSGQKLVQGSKYFDTGNLELNKQLYGNDIAVNLPNDGTTGYRTPRHLDPNYVGQALKMGLAAIPAMATGGGSLLAAIGGGAVGGAAGGLMNDLSGTDLLKAAAAGGVGAGLNAGVLNDLPGYNLQNVAGSAVRGTTNDVVMQAVRNGEIDFKDALQAGLLNVGFDVAGDALGDARQTNPDAAQFENEYVNGQRIGDMSAAEVARISNTTDLYGILGENGLLSKLGMDVGYMPTDYLGDALGFLGMGTPIVGQAAAEERFNQRVSEGMSENAALEMYNQETSRYDERFFDVTSERGNSPLTGIWENNPMAASSGGSISTTGLEGAAGGGSTGRAGFDTGSLPSSNSTPITDELFGNSGPADRDILRGSNVEQPPAAPVQDAPQELPQAPVQDEPNWMTEDELLGGTDGEGELPDLNGDGATQLPSDPVGQAQVEELVTGGGGGGGLPEYTRQFRTVGSVDAELFRLARIPKVVRLDAAGFTELQSAMRALQARKAAITEGDVTVGVDPESSDYVTRVEEDKTTNRMQA